MKVVKCKVIIFFFSKLFTVKVEFIIILAVIRKILVLLRLIFIEDGSWFPCDFVIY